MGPAVADIEDALVAHWSLFGRWPGAQLHDEHGLLWYETPIAHLPYNGVIRTRLGEGADADAAIGSVLERFRRRGATPLWFEHPSATPGDLAARLAANGLRPVAPITCMSLDLGERRRAAPGIPDGVVIREARDPADLAAYTDLTVRYWELPAGERPLVARLHRHWGRDAGRRHLVLLDGEPAGKGYLSLAGPPGVAAIFGMSVRPHARGRGIAAALTAALVESARDLGCRRVVLHSTPMAVGLYRRAGFAERCGLTIHASAPLFSAGE